MEFFNFGLDQQLDRHFSVEFHTDSDGDGFNFPNPQLNPQNAPFGAPKNGIFQLWTRSKIKPPFMCRIS